MNIKNINNKKISKKYAKLEIEKIIEKIVYIKN
jgi:hypothetical protein